MTIVQEFKGRTDHATYITRGIQAENDFIKTAEAQGYTVAIASDDVNMNKHIDLYLTKNNKTVSVDVKARRTSNKGKGFDDLWIVVEFLNTMGNKGWLYGESDYFVFEREHDYVWCDTKELVDLVDIVVDKDIKVSSYKDAEYKTWGRINQGKQDLISRIEMSLIVDLNKTFTMKKILDNNVEVCHTSNINNNNNQRNINMNNNNVITGKAFWVSVAQPNTTFNSDGVWSVDISNLDEKNMAKAQAQGLSIKNKGDERGNFVTAKRNVKRKDGSMNTKPKVVDSAKKDISATLIGNGSDINVLYSTYEWNFSGKAGVSADLHAIQVTSLVEYTAKEDANDAFEVIPDGFVTENADEEISFA